MDLVGILPNRELEDFENFLDLLMIIIQQIGSEYFSYLGWLLSTAITTGSAFENATFDCHRSGMECLHDGICAQDGTRCE